MGNKKKPKKLRTPNVPVRAAATATVAAAPARGASAGQELTSQPRFTRAAPVAAAPATFDYTYVKKDLSRIAILAASFIAALVILSFFIH